MAFPTIPTAAASRILGVNQLNTTATLTGPDLSGLTKSAGDLLIAIAGEYQTNAAAGAAFTGWTNGFTEVADLGGTTANGSFAVAYKWSTGAETGTVNVTRSGTLTGDAAMILISIPGAHATTPPAVGTITHGTTAAADPPALNPSAWDVEDTLWIAVSGNGMTSATGSWTGNNAAPTDYGDYFGTSPADTSTIGDFGLAVAFRQNAVASEDAGPFSTDVSNARNSAFLIAVRPAPSAPTGVSAGADDTHPVNVAFTRTGTATGATSYEWTLESGPGVTPGTVIDSDANLSWTPTTAGTYGLRFKATNSVGTTSDDMTLVVATPAWDTGVTDRVASMTGILGRWRAADLAASRGGTLAHGDAVTSWPAKTGGITLTGVNGPVYREVSGVNNRPAIRLNGTNQAFEGSPWSAIAGQYTASIGVIFMPNDGSGQRELWFFRNWELLNNNGPIQTWITQGVNGAAGSWPTVPAVVTATSPTTGNEAVYSNGTSIASGEAGAMSASASNTKFSVGYTGSTRYLPMDIAEIIVWDHVLDSTELATWHSYAQDADGMTVSDYVAGSSPTPSGTVTGSWSFTGAAAGSGVPQGTITGGWSFTGAAAGSRVSQGTVSGSWSFTGAAVGAKAAQGTVVGGWNFTGAAVGQAPPQAFFRAASSFGLNQSTTTNTVAIVIPASAQVGDVAIVSIEVSSEVGDVTTPPSGWNRRANSPVRVGDTTSALVFTRTLTAGQPGSTVNFVYSATRRMVATCVVVGGATEVGLLAGSFTTGVSTDEVTIPTLANVPAGSLFVATINRRRGGATPADLTWPAGGGYTVALADIKTSYGSIPELTAEAGYKTAPTAGTYGGETLTGDLVTVGVQFALAVPSSAAAGTPTGVVDGGWSFAGAAVGSAMPQGTAVAGWSFTGAATGSTTKTGTVTGSWTFTGAATGSGQPQGAVVGGWSFIGTAAGSKTVQATIAGSWGFTGAAAGSKAVAGVASGSWSFTGAAAGSKAALGTVVGGWSFIGQVEGKHDALGYVSGVWTFTGAALGASVPYDPVTKPVFATFDVDGATLAEFTALLLTTVVFDSDGVATVTYTGDGAVGASFDHDGVGVGSFD